MKKLILMIVLFYSFNAYPGSVGGITLYVKPLQSAMDYKYIIDGFFRSYYGPDNVNTPTCGTNDYIPFVDEVYLNTDLKGIDDNNLLQAIRTRESRLKLSRILSEFKDDKVSGFDGIMFYELKNDEIVFYTFDSRNSDVIYTTRLKVDNLISKNFLGGAICNAISSKILPNMP